MNTKEKIVSNSSLIERRELNRNEYEHMRKSVFRGDTIRLKRGLYVCPENSYKLNYEIEKIVHGGIMCMWSAWFYYDLCDTIPTGICVAVDAHRKVKVPSEPRYDLYYWNTAGLTIGVTTAEESGIKFKIFDRERCVCDAIRFRNKIGFDVVSEIVNRYLSSTDKNMAKLNEYAKIFRISKILKNIIYFK